MKSTLTFCGGTGSVTGANFLLDIGEKKILVDCGSLAQEHVCDDSNFVPFPYDSKSISALIVTHAHADHIGRIPRLVQKGFRGDIYSTAATKDLAAFMFEDALGIMQRESVQHACDMLYEKEDVERAVALWRGHDYHAPFSIADVHLEFLDAGHILGSALIKMTRSGRTILFTGDLGNSPEPLLRDTESPKGANYVVIESVYGDRLHDGKSERTEHLREHVEEIRARKGTLLIPSFSIERTQVLLYEINALVESGSMAPIPIFLDSPLATRITPVFRNYAELFNPAVQERLKHGDDPFDFPGLTVTHSTKESADIHDEPNPKVIIGGAGMSAGGRIRGHEKYYLSDKDSTILFVGYQAPGTLGRRLQDGAKKVVIDDEWIHVRAQVATLSGYSGHADRDQLMNFVERTGDSLERVFVTMGEPKSSIFFAQRVKDFFGVDAIVPEKDDSITLDF